MQAFMYDATERDEVPEIDAPCDGVAKTTTSVTPIIVSRGVSPTEKEEHHLQEQEADGDALQNVDLPEDRHAVSPLHSGGGSN